MVVQIMSMQSSVVTHPGSSYGELICSLPVQWKYFFKTFYFTSEALGNIEALFYQYYIDSDINSMFNFSITQQYVLYVAKD